MAKDPAFLFYPGDWLGGTLGMTLEEKGAYMEVLMLQFNRGHMEGHMIGQVIGQIWDKIKHKFVQDEKGLWFNERLELEKQRRKDYTASRKNNLKGKNQYTKGKKRGRMTSHMENENEDVNKDKDKIYNRLTKFYFAWHEKKVGIKPQFDGSDGKSLNSIITYLESVESGAENVFKNFTALLSNYDQWDKFHRGQTRIRQINANLTNIINHLKNSKNGSGTLQATFDAVDALNRMR